METYCQVRDYFLGHLVPINFFFILDRLQAYVISYNCTGVLLKVHVSLTQKFTDVTDVCMDESAVSSDPVIAFLLDEVVVKDWCKRTFRKITTELQEICILNALTCFVFGSFLKLHAFHDLKCMAVCTS